MKQGEKASNHEHRVLRVASRRLGSLDVLRGISGLGNRKGDIRITRVILALCTEPRWVRRVSVSSTFRRIKSLIDRATAIVAGVIGSGMPKVLFFDLGETLVTQNIEDNLVTQRAL